MKKIISLFLIVVITFLISACGSNTNITSQNTGSKATNITSQNTENKASNNTPNKVYSAGEKWVEDEWEFTINAVYIHNLCNRYDFQNYDDSNPVVVIDYTYKNTGYTENDGLDFNYTHFSVYDADGFSSLDVLACIHCIPADYCIIGASCHAQKAFVMEKNADISKITISVRHYKNFVNFNKGYATFEIPVTQQDIF